MGSFAVISYHLLACILKKGQRKYLLLFSWLAEFYYLLTVQDCYYGDTVIVKSYSEVKSLRITSHASIFTAELVALNLALDIIRRSRRKKFVIFSDTQLSVRNCICTEIHH